jgi:SAM-dependent methyltransferase
LLLKQRPELAGGRTIHFAPEPAVARILRPLASDYQSADLGRRDCDLQLNLERIDLPDQSVDTIMVSHVLEHVDDRAALREMHRCLRPGGAAIIMIPIVEGWTATYENPSVAADRERNLHFGQADHVRYYGADVRDRIRGAGFELEEYSANGADCVRFALMRGETVFIATRPKAE